MGFGFKTITTLFGADRITAGVGSLLRLTEARRAQVMLAGAPRKPGRIVLEMNASVRRAIEVG
jgi:hypothetical protein